MRRPLRRYANAEEVLDKRMTLDACCVLQCVRRNATIHGERANDLSPVKRHVAFSRALDGYPPVSLLQSPE